MPNHITTILTIEDASGLRLAEIRKAFVNDKGHVDLNVVLPAPACLNDFEPNEGVLTRARAALGLLPDATKIGPDDLLDRLTLSNALRDVSTKVRAQDIPSVIRAIQNYAECGYMYWYDWNCEHWGTKWNCYGQPNDGHPADAKSFEFETAWAHPAPMIEVISQKLPGVVFHVAYADEDIGSNCGEYRIQNGQRFDEDIAARWDDRDDAERRRWVEKAFRIRYGKDEPREAHGYDANWQYSDNVYEAYEASREAVAASQQ